MSAAPKHDPRLGYAGLRMTADEFLMLGETAERYELIDGVVVMSPSPTPGHNQVAAEVLYQAMGFAKQTNQASVFHETDVRFAREKVYRPDIAVYVADRMSMRIDRLDIAPDLIVEILSAGTKMLDLITKRDDYDRFGVAEYWTIDPENGDARCWRRQGSRLCEVPIEGSAIQSSAIAGFTLDLMPIRALADR